MAFAEDVLERVISGELSVKRLQELNERAGDGESPGRTKSHYSARAQFMAADGREVGQLKRFRDGRTELKLSGLTEQQQQVLGDRLEAVVREFMTAEEAQNGEAG